jgi:hypothetical protein
MSPSDTNTLSVVTHMGALDPSLVPTNVRPSLAFILKYSSTVDSLDLSSSSTTWYAPSAVFYNGDGHTYSGGDEIWNWMRSLFARFSKLRHDYKCTRVLKNMQNAEGGPCDLLILEVETSFWLKEPLTGPAIVIPRLLMFLVGPAEKGQGTDGLQIWEAKAYWDSATLAREMHNRNSAQEKI